MTPGVIGRETSCGIGELFWYPIVRITVHPNSQRSGASRPISAFSAAELKKIWYYRGRMYQHFSIAKGPDKVQDDQRARRETQILQRKLADNSPNSFGPQSSSRFRRRAIGQDQRARHLHRALRRSTLISRISSPRSRRTESRACYHRNFGHRQPRRRNHRADSAATTGISPRARLAVLCSRT